MWPSSTGRRRPPALLLIGWKHMGGELGGGQGEVKELMVCSGGLGVLARHGMTCPSSRQREGPRRRSSCRSPTFPLGQCAAAGSTSWCSTGRAPSFQRRKGARFTAVAALLSPPCTTKMDWAGGIGPEPAAALDERA